MNIQELDALFKIYGYELDEVNDSYRVYLLRNGMYFGAEIIMLDKTEAIEVRDRYSRLGFSAKIQYFKDNSEVENYLFKGFFKTDYTTYTIQHRYEIFEKNQIKIYADPNIKYEYIDAPFTMFSKELSEGVNGTNIIDSINEIINKKGAQLIIIEAAAGFGKTCTAFELYKSFQRFSDSAKPLFTELSRNRQAKLFKYVLLTEIDHEYNASISSDLVIYNIKNGKIPLIIDGFDELLSKDINDSKSGMLNEFEQVETMLSTIGDLLTGNAKIVLTSRRTAIFTGLEFEKWVEAYDEKFDVTRFHLGKPEIRDWLKSDRYDRIVSHNIPIENIANPVLLTYLRNIEDDVFNKLIEAPETITDAYFEHLLNREKERQNIIITCDDQMRIFENLAKIFVEFNIKCESRNFVKELILEYNREKLLYYQDFLSTKQTIDELADTLTNHALLDRIGIFGNVGFVNEFVYGYLLGKYILDNGISFISKEGVLPEDLLELAISAFQYASNDDKTHIWSKLSRIKNRLSINNALLLDSVLVNSISGSYEMAAINASSFQNVSFLSNSCSFSEVSFVDSKFDGCTFELEAFNNVSFIACTFMNCSTNGSDTSAEHNIHCFECTDYSNGFINSFQRKKPIPIPPIEQQSIEIQILNKFFKVDGKTTKMKYVSHLRSEFKTIYDDVQVYDTFDELRKKGFVQVMGNNSFITQEGINYYHKNK